MIVMGKIVAAHGIRGWVKIQPYTEYLDSLADYETWWLGGDKHAWREQEIEYCEAHNKVLAAKFAGCDDRNAAERLKGMLIAVPRSSMPPEDENEYYWTDLIGLEVVNLKGEKLGTVETLMETGANDVLCVRGEAGQILIPFIEQVVQEVDKAGKIIRVDWEADYLA
jgi:16S rRNA processing protein RimM